MACLPKDRGVSLIETSVAVLIALIVMASVGTTIFVSMSANKNQATETTRITALAQEKMEELLRLNYTDSTTNTTLITDASWNVGLTPNSLTDLVLISGCPATGSPDVGYVDYLSTNAIPFQGSCASVTSNVIGYERRWQITTVAGTTGLKQITVVVYSLNGVAAGAQPPFVSLTSYDSQ